MHSWLVLTVLLLSLMGRVEGGEVSPPAPEVVLETAAKSVEAGDLPAATETLLTLDGQSIPEAQRRQADLLLGIILSRQGRADEAAVRLEAATADALLGDYALYHLAQARRSAGRRDLAADALQRLVAQHPQSIFRERAGREMPRDFLEAGQLVQAEEATRKYLAAVPSNTGRGEVGLTLGEILLRDGRTDQAEEVFRRLWIELPASPESERAKDLLATIPTARPLAADEQLQRAATLYQLGRYGPAIPELTPFAVSGSSRETQARLMLGISAFNVRQYGQAVQWLEPLKDSVRPDPTEALFWLGRSAGRAGDVEKFTEYLTLVADAKPKVRRSEEALYLLAQAAADDADIPKSRAYLTRLLRDYPKGVWTDVALWLQGWLAYKRKEFPAAAASWGRLVAEESGSRWRVPALYWRGRAFEAIKHVAEAATAYRTLLDTSANQYYYRLRATDRLTSLAKKAPLKPAPPVAQPLQAGGTNGLHARKARALRSLGLTHDAVEEWSEQVRGHPEERAGLAEACGAFLDLGRYDKAVWVGTRVLRPLFVQEGGQAAIPGFWQCTYPLGHVDLVRRYAGERALDPYLVLALIREESAFAPQALSRTGARGLMQLMPHTADLTAREHQLPPVAPSALETPEVNIQIGVHHLADLLRDLGGNLSLTLASYNAGKQPVQRWLQRYGFADEVEFVEDIPFTETRNYVKRVLGSYERYNSLYGKPPSASRGPADSGRMRAEKKRAGGR
jgi:soluble lytic murein transglycosylase